MFFVPCLVLKSSPHGMVIITTTNNTDFFMDVNPITYQEFKVYVEEGGETLFQHYGLSVKPKKGKTIIWPAEWTHAHSGGLVKQGCKYIVTGWIQFS